MLEAIGTFIYKYQTLTAGLVGFTGVIITLITNSWLGRRQHERELAQERRSLRAALIAELRMLRDTFTDRQRVTHDADASPSFLVPESIWNDVYKELLPRIGLLTPTEISLVMKAYLLAADLPIRLRLIAEDTQTPQHFTGYITLPGAYAQPAGQLHENFIGPIDQALAALEQASSHDKKGPRWLRLKP